MNEELIRQCAQEATPFYSTSPDAAEVAIRLYHARHVAPLEVERDEADRQAGALMRENAELKDSASRRADWLRKAKQEAGYPDSVSFDVVWEDTLSKARNVAPLVEAAAELVAAMVEYQMHVDGHAPEKHRAMMRRARQALAPFEQEG